MLPQRWRVALIDSGCAAPAAAARFRLVDGNVCREAAVADPSGHGSRIAGIIEACDPAPELLLAQVFESAGPTSAAVVAAALDWACAQQADLIHLSLGLRADRAVLSAAVAAATARGCLLVAAVPARGAVPYPAAYPGVLRATGDARCAPGQLSLLDPGAPLFGGCPRVPGSAAGGGASVGAAQVTRAIVGGFAPVRATLAEVVAGLALLAVFQGPERR